MIDPIDDGDLSQFKGINAVKASHVEAVLLAVGSSLMVRIDTAYRTKIVFSGHGVELIERQFFLAPGNAQTVQLN